MKKQTLVLLFIVFLSCDSGDSCTTTPILSTDQAENITDSSASVSGSIIPPTCDSSIISQGFVISEQNLPTKNDLLIQKNGENISHTFNSLKQNTTYFVRTYFENSLGEFYGTQITFNTTVGAVIISTGNAINIRSSSARIDNNKIDSNGGGSISNYGVCWSTNTSPTVDDSKKELNDTNQPVSFFVDITELEPNTKYYVRAFAENESGIYYGNQLDFQTSFGYKDYEGNTYDASHIHREFETNLYFISENLKTKFFANGDEILKVNNLEEAQEAINNQTPAWCYYNFDDSNSNRGKLYNSFVINDSRSIGLGNWRLPTDDELIISFDRVAQHYNPKYDVWGGDNADALKQGGSSGFDAFETNQHAFGQVQDANNFIMWSSSTTYAGTAVLLKYRVIRALKFDNSINKDKTLRGLVHGDRLWFSIRLVYKNQ